MDNALLRRIGWQRVWLLPLLLGCFALACGRTSLDSEAADGGEDDDFGSGGDGGSFVDAGPASGGFSGGGGRGGKAGSGGRGGSAGASVGGSGGFRSGGGGGNMAGGSGGLVTGGSGGGAFSQLTITPGSAAVAVGQSTQYRALAVQNGTQRDVSTQVAWSVAPPARATIIGSGADGGRVTGVDAGQAEVTASFGLLTAKARLQVVKDTLLSLRTSPESVRVNPGATSQVTVDGVYESGAVRNMTDAVTWQVDAPMLVEHTHLGLPGLLRAGMVEGQTTIRVAASGVEATLPVKVVDDNRFTVVVEPATATRRVGETINFRALGVFEDGTQRNVTNTAAWTSSDPRVATVERGVARCFSSGDVVLVVSVDDVASTARLTCSDAQVTLLRLTPVETEVPVGTRLQYTATAFFSDGSSRNVTSATAFKTSDNAIVTVTLRGLATTVGAGQAKIEGTFEGASGQATLTAR